ncbi:MAG: FAD-binding oxidoreductase [Acidimicrobiales bacterium]|jgi:FAD/FMN-containing dehydrogenase
MERYDRRRFLRGGGLVVAGAASASLWGCGDDQSGTSHRGPSPTASPSASTTSTTLALDAAAWSALATSLSGRLVLPSSPSYATDRLLYDPRFDDLNPAAVAYCASPSDVQRCVSFARAHGIDPIPRCGGHSYGGYSSGPGLVVDVTPMDTVTVTRAAGAPRTDAVVGAGTLLVDLYDQLARAGVLVPGGSCPTVGISGLALGGGVGVVGRKYGLTCDAILSVDIVTADGRLLRCDASTHDDLYWACRGGGGGNFGVVTSFTFRAAPIPELALFTLDWPWAAAAEVLGSWFEWQHGGPDELWSNCQLLSTGTATTVRTAGMLVGSPSSLGSLVDALVQGVGSAPSYRFVGPEEYLHAMLVEAGCESLDVAQCHLTTQNPAGTLDRAGSVASSAYVSALPPAAGIDAFVSTVVDLSQTLPGLGGGLVFDALGGAINAVEPGDTAFVHRNAVCGIEASVATGASPSAVSQGRSWLAHFAGAAAGYVDGSAYQNYIDPTLVDWQQAYYGPNLGRLVAVKAAYDPDDVFHFAQSIPTSLAPGAKT